MHGNASMAVRGSIWLQIRHWVDTQMLVWGVAWQYVAVQGLHTKIDTAAELNLAHAAMRVTC